MTKPHTSPRRLTLRSLTPEQRNAVSQYCAGVSIERGVDWLKGEFGITVSRSWLAQWLKHERTGVNTVEIRKTRSNCKILALSGEQQNALFEHCNPLDLEEGVKWLAAEFGIVIRAKSLRNWLNKERICRPIQEQLQSIEDDRDRATLIANVGGAAAALTEANVVLIAQAVFEELRKPADMRNVPLLVKYMTLALKARDQDLKSRSIDLNTDRFKFDATKRTKECFPQLQQIFSGDGDEREKIEKAIIVLFGQAPDPEEAAA